MVQNFLGLAGVQKRDSPSLYSSAGLYVCTMRSVPMCVALHDGRPSAAIGTPNFWSTNRMKWTGET